MEDIVMEHNKHLKLRIVAFLALLVLGYTILSANCATGGSCRFASGYWFNWLATIVSR